jgi:hypothetical protein
MAGTGPLWIVQGPAVANGDVSALVNADPHISEHRRVADDVVVLSMSDERAKTFKSEVGPSTLIEQDQDIPDPRM